MKRTILIILVIFSINMMFAQEHPRGLIIDKQAYQKIPLKAKTFLKGDLPNSYSLKKYTPNVKSQGQYGTCTGWATGWALRSTLEAIDNNWSNKSEITKNAFSPIFAYFQANDERDGNCKTGSSIEKALYSMKELGIPHYKDFPPMCASSVPSEIYDLAKKHKIKDYNRLLDYNMDSKTKIENVKNAIFNNHPVAIGILCPNSFDIAKGAWQPTEMPASISSAHAIVVIGYDDNKYGGAFEIMNSWGNDWGNNGYIWIKYTDFTKYTLTAIEAYLSNKKKNNTIAGSIDFISTDRKLNVRKVAGINSKGLNVVGDDGKIADYEITETLYSGDRYRMLASVNKPVYLYAVASDLKNNTSVIFPNNNKISPYISVENTKVPIPNEQYWIQLDNTTGVDFLIVIYSLKELDIQSIKNRIKSHSGNINDKIEYALGDIVIGKKDCFFENNKINFSANVQADKAVSIVIKMNHK